VDQVSFEPGLIHVYQSDVYYKLLNAHQPVQNSLPIGRQVPLKDRRGAMAGLLPGSANAYIDGVTMILSPRIKGRCHRGEKTDQRELRCLNVYVV